MTKTLGQVFHEEIERRSDKGGYFNPVTPWDECPTQYQEDVQAAAEAVVVEYDKRHRPPTPDEVEARKRLFADVIQAAEVQQKAGRLAVLWPTSDKLREEYQDACRRTHRAVEALQKARGE